MTTTTTMMPTIDPLARPAMSIAPPMCTTSEMPMLTTSPAASRFGSVAPSCVTLATVASTVRKAARIQFSTEKRCRSTPAPACSAPSPSSSAVQRASAPPSRAVTPASIAWPITAGISACATIQTMPVQAAASNPRAWMRATHRR